MKKIYGELIGVGATCIAIGVAMWGQNDSSSSYRFMIVLGAVLIIVGGILKKS